MDKDALLRSITATLTYIGDQASLAELFGLQAYLSKLASQMSAPVAARHGPQAPWDEALWQEKMAQSQEIPYELRQQLAEVQRQQTLMRAQQDEQNAVLDGQRQDRTWDEELERRRQQVIAARDHATQAAQYRQEP